MRCARVVYRAVFACVWGSVLSISPAISQHTYYVDPSGADNDDGLSPGTAWQTISKLNGRSFSPGDVVLFRRGGVWKENWTPSGSGTAGNPITYAAYGTGLRPIVTTQDRLPGWNTAGNWTNIGGNLWRWSTGLRTISRLWLSGVEFGPSGYDSADPRPGGSTTPDATFRWFFHNNGDLDLYASGNPATTYSSIEADYVSSLHGATTLDVNGAAYLLFRDLDIRGGQDAVHLNWSDYSVFDSCNIGAASAWYGLINKDGRSDHVEIRYCVFDRADNIQTTWSSVGADNLTISRGSFWDIHHSKFVSFKHSGVGVDPPRGDCSGNYHCDYNRVHDNEFTNRQVEYGRAFLVNSGCDSDPAKYNEFYRNYIHGVRTQIQIAGKYNKVYYNIIDTVLQYTYTNNDYGSNGIAVANYDGSWYNEIYNNVIMNCAQAGMYFGNSTDRVDHITFSNNILFNNGLVNTGYEGSDHLELWIEGTMPNLTMENNLIFNPRSANTIIFDGGSTKITVADFNTRSQYSRTLHNNVTGDPGLQYGYHIPANSPARDAGKSVAIGGAWDNADFWENPVPENGAPDIGVNEYGTVDNAPLRPPVLVSPSTGATGQPTTVLLRWSSAPAASSYDIELSQEPQFLSPVQNDTGVAGTSRAVTALSPGVRYYWRARSRSQGRTSTYSTTWDFTTGQTIDTWTETDVTAEGNPVALVTSPLGSGSKSIEVIRDGINPPVGSSDPTLQYDTWTGESRGFDWIGYTFPQVMNFTRLVFQEGIRYGTAGGWFAGIGVQVRAGGQWQDVPGVVISPSYSPGGGVNFATYEISFPWISGDGIRLAGVPGGTATYISVAELRSYASVLNPLVVPSFVQPPDGALGQHTALSLRWTATFGATRYHVQLSMDSLFRTSIIDDSTFIDTVDVVRGLSTNTTYYRRVRAENYSGWTPFCRVSYFRTGDVPTVERDVTVDGTPVALVISPQGSGNHDLETIRDGVMPPAGSSEPALQYDTWDGQSRTFDWIGYVFPVAQNFSRLVFQEGIRYGTSGGWFAQLGVQVRTGSQWADVSGVVASPAYPVVGGVNFAAYELTFPPVTGDGVRLAGNPGGTGTYISVAELRAFAFSDDDGKTEVAKIERLPEISGLSQNYPNPFNPRTEVGYQVSTAGMVEVKVYDILGRVVAILVNERKAPGSYSVAFDASALASGVYFCTLTAGDTRVTKKMVLMR